MTTTHAPETRALLALFDSIPWSQAAGGRADRLMIRLRSSRTLSEMVADQGWDTNDPDTRWTYGTQIEAAEANPNGYWEQSWPLTQPRRDGWAADWSVEQWAAHESAQFPAGFYPVSRARKELPEGMADEIRDELRSGTLEAVRHAAQRVTAASAALTEAQATRDAAIRSALGAGVPVADLVKATGVTRGRIYQLKGK